MFSQCVKHARRLKLYEGRHVVSGSLACLACARVVALRASPMPIPKVPEGVEGTIVTPIPLHQATWTSA